MILPETADCYKRKENKMCGSFETQKMIPGKKDDTAVG